MIKKYLLLILKKWYYLIGIGFFILDKLFSFDISKDILYTIILVGFIVSTYLVWKDEYNEKIQILKSKDLIKSIQNSTEKITNLYKKTYMNSVDNDLEKVMNMLISDLKIVYSNDFLDENQLKIIELEIKPLIQIIKNKKYEKFISHDPSSGKASFELDDEMKEKYLNYVKQISLILKIKD
ncbi:MAG: hypothetical protein U9Q20_07225 [Campylobacterota bacterium]|nr:hypothetical protein [Campylobacterota bacterium]